jgi:hypothetical protein
MELMWGRNDTKMDTIRQILRLHPHSGTEEEFIKIFQALATTTDGILCFSCIDGVVCYPRMIMGGEGASDVCDALLVLRPKIMIYDFAPGIVRHIRFSTIKLVSSNRMRMKFVNSRLRR